MKTQAHKIEVKATLEGASWGYTEGYWVIRITGVTSGVKIHGGDGDTMSIEFRLDASRFHPVITQ